MHDFVNRLQFWSWGLFDYFSGGNNFQVHASFKNYFSKLRLLSSSKQAENVFYGNKTNQIDWWHWYVFGENKILNQHYGLTILKFKNILVQSEDFNRIGNKNF